MPRPTDSADVRASKTLSYILRHGAEKEGLHMRQDGFVRLSDVLARPKLRDVNLETVLRLVAENAKQRFALFYGYDPSPAPPKKGKGGRGLAGAAGKGKGQGKKKEKADVPARAGSPQAITALGGPRTDASPTEDDSHRKIDAAAFENSAHDLANGDNLPANSAPTGSDRPASPHLALSAELPLIPLPLPAAAEDDPPPPTSDSSPPPPGEYFIRATQGHSIPLESVAHLHPVRDDEKGREMIGEMVHGTRWELWEVLSLSRMSRQHIHLAPSLSPSSHRITPRPTSTLLIYLDLAKLLVAGIPVYVSANGVVLTPGDENGVVRKEYWRRAEKFADRGSLGKGSRRLVVWRNGKEVADPVLA